MSDFTRRKLEWLDAVSSDPRLHNLSVALAVKLAVRYLNSETEEAWPGIDRLAHELNADRRSVQRALDRLVDGGWLRRKRGGGRANTNTYQIKGGVAVVRAVETPPLKEHKGRRFGPEKGGVSVPKGRSKRRPNPRENPGRRRGASAALLMPLL